MLLFLGFVLYTFLTIAEGNNVVTFTAPSTNWTVPSWVSTLEVFLYGQPGANNGPNLNGQIAIGGEGGFTHGILNVIPGEILNFNVNFGGFCGGGGASDIRQGGFKLR